MSVLSADRIEVGPDRLEALVRVSDPSTMRTSCAPGLADRALALLPGLARHTCENGTGLDVLSELRDTETPHLLEHLTMELMALSGSPRSLRACTTWDFARDGRGVFRVRLEYDDDIVALGALKEALDIVAWLVNCSEEEPDVEAVVGRLRGSRRDQTGE